MARLFFVLKRANAFEFLEFGLRGPFSNWALKELSVQSASSPF
jgi:hypothetical protein